jgi:hypothetical protein
MRSLSRAVNVRRRGRDYNSGDAEAGADTTVGIRPSPASALFCMGSMGISEMILPRLRV